MSAPAEIRDAVRKSRAAQGLPPHVTDPIICQRVADILRAVPTAQPAPRKRRVKSAPVDA